MTEEQIHNAVRKGFADQFRSSPEMLNKSIVELTRPEMECLLIGICKEFMFAKKNSFSLNEAQAQAFEYVLDRIRKFVERYTNLDWLPFRLWDVELVDEFVYLVYINFDYKYCEITKEKPLADTMDF